MNFLVTQIREQKLLEMEVALEDFIKSNGISDSAIIHTMIFDKEVFESEKEVREYLRDKFMHDPDITENNGEFTAVLVPSFQVNPETEVEVEIRRGVKAKAADLVITPGCDEFYFNDKGEALFGCSRVEVSKEIQLTDGLPFIIEVARVAEGEHPVYGKLSITKEHLKSFTNNFKSKAAGVDLAINEDHKKNEAFGWFKDLFLSQDESVLFAQVVWNSKGTQALSEKEYRYFSPEFRFNYTHPHTGVEHGPTLLGGALTNYPFLKMEAITELNNKVNEEDNVPQNTIDLNTHNEKVVELTGKVNEAEKKLSAKETENKELSDKVKELEAKIDKKDKEAAHQKLFDNGKINKAQLVALNEGKSHLEVFALSEDLNTEGKGSSQTPEGKDVELSDGEKQVAEKLGLTPEEFAKANQ